MSNKFESTNKIRIYETDGTENKMLGGYFPTLDISEHWNRKDLVTLKIEDIEYTVSADALKRAIENAQNAHSF